MNEFEIREIWNGKAPIEDPEAEYLENLIYIEWKEKRLECYFESRKLVHGFLRNDYAEIEEIHYYKNRPISVKGYLPLGCLRIKGKKRRNEKEVI